MLHKLVLVEVVGVEYLEEEVVVGILEEVGVEVEFLQEEDNMVQGEEYFLILLMEEVEATKIQIPQLNHLIDHLLVFLEVLWLPKLQLLKS